MTTYLVLVEKFDAEHRLESATYEVVGEFEAHSSEQAIRKAVEKLDGGTYVAVPARSWDPVPVEKVETVQIKIGKAATS